MIFKFRWRTPRTNYKPLSPSPWDHFKMEWSGLVISLYWRHCAVFLGRTINCRIRGPFPESPGNFSGS